MRHAKRVIFLVAIVLAVLGTQQAYGAQIGKIAALTFSKQAIGNATAAEYGHVFDLDNDGDLDVLGTSYTVGSNTLRWWENNGAGSFNEHIIAASDFERARTIYAADLDGDSDNDVLGASADDGFAWWENDGSENFSKHTFNTSGSSPRCVFAIDMDGDHDIDVLGTFESEKSVVWWENNGSGSFNQHKINATAISSYWVRAADLDGDQDTDVLHAGSTTIRWYQNDGNQNFTERILDNTLSGANYVSAVDLDGDQDLDVLGIAYVDGVVLWWENKGGGTFDKHTIDDGLGAPFYIAPGDMDNDGDIDVAGALQEDDKLVWWENNGSQAFTLHEVATDFNHTQYVDLGDIDADGDLDVVASAYSSAEYAWWQSSGGSLDTTAPATIDNLEAQTGIVVGSVDLSWIAPGDDGSSATATVYEVRFSTAAINAVNWDSATPVGDAPVPAVAGSVQNLTISSLTPGQEYYFAIRTRDEVGNQSGVSNSPSAVAKSGLVNPSSGKLFLPLITNNFDPNEIWFGEHRPDANGQIMVDLPGGDAAVFQLMNEDGLPLKAVDITSAVDGWGITLIAADDNQVYLPRIVSVPTISLTLKSKLLTHQALQTPNVDEDHPYEIGLHKPTVDNVLVENRTNINLDHLRQLPNKMDNWEQQHETLEEFLKVSPWVVTFATPLVEMTKGAVIEAHTEAVVHFFAHEDIKSLSEIVADFLDPHPAQQHIIITNQQEFLAIDLGIDPDAGTTGIIFGQVVDEFTNIGLEGISVQLGSNADYSATTLPNGWYQIEGVPADTYQVHAQLPGFNNGNWLIGAIVTINARETTYADPVEMDKDDHYHEIMENGDFETGTAYPWSSVLTPKAEPFIIEQSGNYVLQLGKNKTSFTWDEEFESEKMFMPAGTESAILTYKYKIASSGSPGTDDAFYVDICYYSLGLSRCTGDLGAGPVIKTYTQADDTGDSWVTETIELFDLEKPEWEGHLPRLFWVRFRSEYSQNDPQTVMYLDDISIQVKESSGDITLDQVYTTDYWGNYKSTFRPGEAIFLHIEATNQFENTIDMIYRWETYDPNSDFVDNLSYGDWTVSQAPETKNWHIDRGLPTDAVIGQYEYTGYVRSDATNLSGTTAFWVEGSPISINFLQALTCKDVQNGDCEAPTTTFTTADTLVYAWTAWEGAEGPHQIRWEWYRPDGAQFHEYPYFFTADEALYYVWSSVYVNAMKAYPGQWEIKTYMDDVLIHTQTFTLQTSQLQTHPAPPME